MTDRPRDRKPDPEPVAPGASADTVNAGLDELFVELSSLPPDGTGLERLALERASGRPVLLKTFSPEWIPARWTLDHLRSRALVQWKLDLPGILQVVEYRLTPDGLVGVFEQPAGVKLFRLLQRTGPLPDHAAAMVAIQIGAALAGAHRIGTPHGCLSASSVWVAPGGAVQITDFDLAPLRAASGHGPGDYSCPGDVPLFGRLAYLLMTAAEAPASGPPPAPSTIYPGVSPGMEQVVLRALDASSPPYTDMGSILDALRASAAGIEGRSFPWPRVLTEETRGARNGLRHSTG